MIVIKRLTLLVYLNLTALSSTAYPSTSASRVHNLQLDAHLRLISSTFEVGLSLRIHIRPSFVAYGQVPRGELIHSNNNRTFQTCNSY